MQDRAFANPKIEFLWDTVVEDLVGDERLEGVAVRNVNTGETSTLPVTGVFVAIGHRPNTDLFAGLLDTRRERLPRHGRRLVATNIEGVFACGDVQDHTYRQAITAAGSGCMAAIDAERWLEAQHALALNLGDRQRGMSAGSRALQLGTLGPPPRTRPDATKRIPDMALGIVNLSTSTFDELVHGSDKPVVVDFWAEWCGPCKAIAPILDELATELGDQVTIAKVNVDDNPDLAMRYNVMSIPTLLVFSAARCTSASSAPRASPNCSRSSTNSSFPPS